jgi:hypothetical protein
MYVYRWRTCLIQKVPEVTTSGTSPCRIADTTIAAAIRTARARA